MVRGPSAASNRALVAAVLVFRLTGGVIVLRELPNHLIGHQKYNLLRNLLCRRAGS